MFGGQRDNGVLRKIVWKYVCLAKSSVFSQSLINLSAQRIHVSAAALCVAADSNYTAVGAYGSFAGLVIYQRNKQAHTHGKRADYP